ncbi:thioredoxin family protein [Marinifilum caeruleilacunae]|uniref:Thioredoxin family protein n=1 Tax=Marinifilum caeruleilacunae TaxID=2499076 RepID=A0ABX1X169_9BACT|nr:thioredoxin family protein [Marinifilum caeruleilacunae]NOU62148.1 thioredoxin family protein [Marinifilum caeruleilacunae]
MNKILILLFFLGISSSLFSQNKTIEDTRLKKQVLYGKLNLQAFEMDLCKDWYTKEYKSFTAKKGVVNKLGKQSFENIRIDLILASWCHDSHREVPRFIKILEKIQFPFDQLHMNALDTNKESPDYDAKANKVSRVPTVIVYRNDLEIGRIIETPIKSLEKDLLKILSKN